MSDYTRNHDGRLPFAPVPDLGEFRREVAVDCAIVMDLPDFVVGEYREKRIAEGIALGRYFSELLSAAIWRSDAEKTAAVREVNA